MKITFKYQILICCSLTGKNWLLFIQKFSSFPIADQQILKWVVRLFDIILWFESTLYALIKTRLRDGLDHLWRFSAPFLNLFAASKQNVDLEYLFKLALPTIAPKIKLCLLYLFSSKLVVNFDLITYIYITFALSLMAPKASRQNLICWCLVWNVIS